MPPGVGQRARRYPSSFVLPMRPVVDHFRKTPLDQKQCTPQPAVELRLAGARRILPILAPRPTALAVAPARLRGRQRFPRTVAHRSSPISRRAEPLSQVRHPRNAPVSRGPDAWISGLFIGNRKSAVRSGVGRYGRGAAPRHRFSAGLPRRPASNPLLAETQPIAADSNFEERGSEQLYRSHPHAKSEQLCRCPEIRTPGFPENYRETPQVCRGRPEIGRRSGRPLANPGRWPVRLERRVSDPYFRRTLLPEQPTAA